MKTDFEQWLAAQFAETGAFTIFIVLVRIGDDSVEALKSTFAQMIGDDMSWAEMTVHHTTNAANDIVEVITDASDDVTKTFNIGSGVT